nr:MAG TPA: hypothetical protein [Caudoviricetes sp.]
MNLLGLFWLPYQTIIYELLSVRRTDNADI